MHEAVENKSDRLGGNKKKVFLAPPPGKGCLKSSLRGGTEIDILVSDVIYRQSWKGGTFTHISFASRNRA
jgi:hypothetical protein